MGSNKGKGQDTSGGSSGQSQSTSSKGKGKASQGDQSANSNDFLPGISVTGALAQFDKECKDANEGGGSGRSG